MCSLPEQLKERQFLVFPAKVRKNYRENNLKTLIIAFFFIYYLTSLRKFKMDKSNSNEQLPNPTPHNTMSKSNRRKGENGATFDGRLDDSVRKNKDFEEKYEEIIDYTKSQGFDVFPVRGDIFLYSYAEYELEWEVENDWRGFFQVAKNAGCTMIISVTANFDKEFAMDYLQGKSFNNEISLSKKQSTELERLSQFSKMIGAFKFAWIKEGIEYSYIEEADWLKTIQQSLLDLGKSKRASLKDSGHRRYR